DQPFLLYYVPGGTHSPHQPTKEWIAKFRGKFDLGWEKLREQIFDNQKRRGCISQCPPRTLARFGAARRRGSSCPARSALSPPCAARRRRRPRSTARV